MFGLFLPALWPLYGAHEKIHHAASNNLAVARREAREFGEERRLEIRRRVQERRERENGQDPNTCSSLGSVENQ